MSKSVSLNCNVLSKESNCEKELIAINEIRIVPATEIYFLCLIKICF